MDEFNMKEVFFNQYCNTCVYKDLEVFDEPCDECLNVPARANSHKPLMYIKNKEA